MLFKNSEDLVLNGETPVLQKKRRDVLDMLTAAVDAVQPYDVVKKVFCGSQMVFPSESIDLSTFDHIFLAGFGKASVGMAQAICDSVPVTKGVVITNDPSAKVHHDSVEVIIGGHPLPDEKSILGTEKILHLFEECSDGDCILVCISGGGSSLFCKPLVPLQDLQKTVELLLWSGATITEINTVRKHLSLVKGGRLISSTKAVVVSLIISDIVHDPIGSIASGPTAPDPSTFSDVKEILTKLMLWEVVPSTVRQVVENGLKGIIPETLKEQDPAFEKVFHFIVANNEVACQAALQKAQELGYDGNIVSTSVTGEARVVGKYLADRALSSLSKGKTVFISGGETTVIVSGGGSGGRNQELVLGCVSDIAGKDVVIASFATDGIDGNSDGAGALADGCTLARAEKKKLDPRRFLKENNSSVFFKGLGDILYTGRTGTNVMDIQILVL